MLVVISPAKRLDWASVDRADLTRPAFEKNAMSLARTARNLTLRDLKALMDISDDLAKLNRDRFKAFEEEPGEDALRPAAFAFAGDTYQGLEAASLSEDALRWAQDHLRILSGLYGVLRPLDQIQAYRLEMGSRLKTRRGGSLYDYWGKEIGKALRAQAEETGAKALVNCASQEYFGAVDLKALGLPVITPSFYEEKDGSNKMISFFAKRARGAMARFIVENRITDARDLRDFDLGGYAFDPERSEDGALAFVRPQPEAAKAA
ncbi:MAG: peroxide stress protein YaaA [Pseudomonadota bacterium]